MEHTLQNVGYSALLEAETSRLHPAARPNWQLVRFKDRELRLALPATLNRLSPHEHLAMSLKKNKSTKIN